MNDMFSPDPAMDEFPGSPSAVVISLTPLYQLLLQGWGCDYVKEGRPRALTVE